jgi:predicted RecB family nuclease
MSSEGAGEAQGPPRPLLDASVVTRCRRRVHLSHDPRLGPAESAPGPAVGQRIVDRAEHRRAVGQLLARLHPGLVEITPEQATMRLEATAAAVQEGAALIWNPALPDDPEAGRRGRIDALIRVDDGYLPVLVVAHRITDPGAGARTSVLERPWLGATRPDPARKARAGKRDALTLAHALRLAQAAGWAPTRPAAGAVIGRDADVLLWHDLIAPRTSAGSVLTDYDERFADRLAIASAAAAGEPALASPSRVRECRTCPWWRVCGPELRATRDVSLVLGNDAAAVLRGHGISSIDALAALHPGEHPELSLPGRALSEAVALARAWRSGFTLVRRRAGVSVPRAEVEVDVDLESYGESGAYLWGCLLSGADIGEVRGYRSFVTWEPLPGSGAGRAFCAFWRWLSRVRARSAALGHSFRAYCYNAAAENRWLVCSAERFASWPGAPRRAEVDEFIRLDAWVDLYRSVSRQFLCVRGRGLKVLAPVSGFRWRGEAPGGEHSLRWYRAAVGLDSGTPDPGERARILAYNEDDVLATRSLREWISHRAEIEVPTLGELAPPGSAGEYPGSHGTIRTNQDPAGLP